MRQKISATCHLKKINAILETDLSDADLREVKIKLDAHFRLLGKVLPNLRSVENRNIVT